MGGSSRMEQKDYAAASCAVSESIAVSPSPACAAAWSFCCVCVQRNATRVVSKHSRHALQYLHTKRPNMQHTTLLIMQHTTRFKMPQLYTPPCLA